MLPLSNEEVIYLKERSNFLKMAYNALFKNMLVQDCGQMVLDKALKMGLTAGTPIREFFAYQIMVLPEDIKTKRPGYKLVVNGVEISNHRQKVVSEINRVFNSPLKIGNYIQGPRNCSQLVSHIHGFLFSRERDTFNDEFYKTYINLDDIISLRCQGSKTPPRGATVSPRPPPHFVLNKKSNWCCGKPCC